ncbi:MAG: DUF2569 family protein [Pantoea sp.]|uniref:DUF2569 family protein n=1 Tax=Pantoea sp. TaxID=69393 RepID=UPI0039E4A06A
MKDNKEINGVLYLPALGLLFSCVAGTWNYFSIIRMFWMKLAVGQPVAWWLAAYMIVAGAVSLAWTWYAAVLFYTQKKRARMAMITYYALAFILYVPFFLILHIFWHVPMDMRVLLIISSAAAGVIIWIPYFTFSRRIPVVFYK